MQGQSAVAQFIEVPLNLTFRVGRVPAQLAHAETARAQQSTRETQQSLKLFFPVFSHGSSIRGGASFSVAARDLGVKFFTTIP